MAFPLGNDYGKKRKLMENVLRRAIAQDDEKRLRRACERLMTSAASGKTWQERMAAFNTLADRLDGKVLAVPDAMGDGQLVVSWVMAAQPQAIEHADRSDTLPAPQDVGDGAARTALSPDHPLDVVVQAEK